MAKPSARGARQKYNHQTPQTVVCTHKVPARWWFTTSFAWRQSRVVLASIFISGAGVNMFRPNMHIYIASKNEAQDVKSGWHWCVTRTTLKMCAPTTTTTQKNTEKNSDQVTQLGLFGRAKRVNARWWWNENGLTASWIISNHLWCNRFAVIV